MERKKPELRWLADGKLNERYVAPLSLLRGCGYSYEDLAKPRIAIVNTFSEMNPGHIHLKELGENVRRGIREAGGMPFEFNCVSVCDSVCEGPYVLPSRDLLVNEIELLVEGNKMDAMVMLGTCDKVVPGLLMAAARLDIPAIIVTGGYMRTGSFHGEKCDFINIGQVLSGVLSGTMTQEDLNTVIENACPGPGACGMMGTANSMCIIAETLGMTYPGNSTTCAEDDKLKEMAYRAGKEIMTLWENGVTARKIITEASVTNAVKVCMAVGGSSNTIIHLPAVATEAELDMECSRIYTDASNEIPLLVGIRPNHGMHSMTEFDEAGGLTALLSSLSSHLDLNTLTVTGKTLGENLEENPEACVIKNPALIHTMDDPVSNDGGLVLCKGNLAPDGAIIKRSAAPVDMIEFRGPANVFDDCDDAIRAIYDGRIHEGEVVIIRYLGIKAGPATAYPFVTALKGSKLKDKVALVTDGRTSGAAAGACFQYASPEAYQYGPICVVENGDIIHYDIDNQLLEIELTDEELAERLEKATVDFRPKKGFLGIYQKTVGPFLKGAVMRGNWD